MPNIANPVTTSGLDTKLNEAKDKITKITNLASTTALNAVENKIPHVINLVQKENNYGTKIEKKITAHDHEKYITTT